MNEISHRPGRRHAFGDIGDPPGNGTVAIASGSATVTSNLDADFNGADRFDFTLPDGHRTATGTGTRP